MASAAPLVVSSITAHLAYLTHLQRVAASLLPIALRVPGGVEAAQELLSQGVVERTRNKQ